MRPPDISVFFPRIFVRHKKREPLSCLTLPSSVNYGRMLNGGGIKTVVFLKHPWSLPLHYLKVHPIIPDLHHSQPSNLTPLKTDALKKLKLLFQLLQTVVGLVLAHMHNNNRDFYRFVCTFLELEQIIVSHAITNDNIKTFLHNT